MLDVYLTRDLKRAHIVDFNAYEPYTDSLLFTYEELEELLGRRETEPELRVIDSRSHAAANANVPEHQHNMVPLDALAIGNGLTVDEFASKWQESLGTSNVGE